MPSPLTLLSLLVLAGGGIVLLDLVIRRTGLGFALVLLGLVLETLLFNVSLRTSVGPFSIHPNDVIFGLLGVAAIARLLRSPRVHPLQLLALVFLALLLWSTIRGSLIYGPNTALNEARKHFTYAAALLYFSTMSLETERPDRFVTWWIALGAYLLAVAVGRWTAFFAGFHAFLPEGATLRVIDSFATVVLVTGFLLAAGPLLRDRTGPQRLSRSRPTLAFELFLVASFLAIVLLQHRTLWIALVLGVTLLTMRDPRLTGRLVIATLVGGVFLSIGLIAVFGQGVERIVTDDLSSSATQVGTFEWRVEGWTRLLETDMPRTPDELLLGPPFGGGFDRYIDGRLVTVSPHNYAVESFLRVGLAGLASFVLLHVIVVVRLYPTTQRVGRLRPDALAAAIVVLFLYYMTSHPSAEHGAITGFAVAVAMRSRFSRGRRSPARHEERAMVTA